MPPPASLDGCWKGAFPFALGTTSFIYPENYANNAARLAPCFDAIELLFFEPNADALPERAEIDALGLIAARWSVSYNIHLPLDLPLGHVDSRHRHAAIDALLRVIDLARPLAASTWTLHLEPDRALLQGASLDDWRARMRDSCLRLLERSDLPARRFSVENLLYPFEWVEPLVAELGVSICMDVGHLLRGGQDPLAFWHRHHDAIRIVHLQGVRGGRDHQPLDRLDPPQLAMVHALLEQVRCEVMLELFSLPHLCASLAVLDRWRCSRIGA